MPGPPPNPNARRRNHRPGAVLLPAGGYQGPIPDWPLAGRRTKAEEAAWPAIWRKPQAAAWAEQGLASQVARYVRFRLKSEQPHAPAALLAEVRQMEDRLGLSSMSMLRLQWTIVRSDLEDRQADQEAEDRRSRVRAVEG